MPPMGTNMATLNGEVSQEQLEYYELRAKGGTGLITIENICIDFPFASNGTTQLRIDNDQYIPRLFKLTETLHKHGACVSIQLNHAGASAYAYRLEGQTPLSSSTTPSKKHGNIPRPMTHEEIYHAVEKFGDAAERVRRAGFDCVEIHAGHSYLISQFLSPLFNKRTDEFGGSVENRARLVLEVVDAVCQEWSPDRIGIRVSPIGSFQNVDNGPNEEADALYLIEELAKRGIAYLHMSEPDWAGGKPYTEAFRQKVRERFHGVIIGAGAYTPEKAEDLINKGLIDAVAFGRDYIANPDLVARLQKKAALNPQRPESFYGGGAEGYTDYPSL